GLTRILFDNTEVSAAVFRDRLDTQAVFVGSPDGRPKVLILDTSDMPSQGIRVHANRQFRNFEAGIGFTSVTGVGMDANPPERIGPMSGFPAHAIRPVPQTAQRRDQYPVLGGQL